MTKEVKEEKLKELMNRISLALKDATLQQGFEIICKRIAELEKNYEDSLIAYGVLKAKVDTLTQSSPLESMQDALITTQKAQNEKQKEQLTRAKELIGELISSLSVVGECEEEECELLNRAEQFLRE